MPSCSIVSCLPHREMKDQADRKSSGIDGREAPGGWAAREASSAAGLSNTTSAGCEPSKDDVSDDLAEQAEVSSNGMERSFIFDPSTATHQLERAKLQIAWSTRFDSSGLHVQLLGGKQRVTPFFEDIFRGFCAPRKCQILFEILVNFIRQGFLHLSLHENEKHPQMVLRNTQGNIPFAWPTCWEKRRKPLKEKCVMS